MSVAESARELRFATQLLLRRPFQVLVQVTNRCNMRCSFCDFWPNGARPEEELTVADYERLASQLGALGTFFVSVEGGEPLLRPDLVDIIRALSRRHLTVLYTNGWHVTEALARALFDAGLTQLGVSIDSADDARHDAKRGLEGAAARAWRALEVLRDAAPHGARQVHAMTVLMRDNQGELPRLLERSAALGVGHCLTLISTKGYRRARTEPPLPRSAELGRGRGEGSLADAPPDVAMSQALAALWVKHPHFRVFREYLEGIDTWLSTPDDLPPCRAGEATFNVDHLGFVSPCVEKSDVAYGNVRAGDLGVILPRMRAAADARACQDCWTLCRGFAQALGGGGSARSVAELATRMRSR